ncbi:MAG TPA: D-alanine--D-alanine ligase family protein [Anaeromyxobacteraceae bacterium]|nr:D-alanine--D-alanine ligase family protein [Anaeromyxobacteraceae bacterium]
MSEGKLHVGLLYGGHSSEHEVSITSARNVFAALAPEKYRVTPIRIDQGGRWFAERPEASVLSGTEGEARPVLFSPADRGAEVLVRLDGGPPEPLALDVVIPMLHGQNGEDGRVQGFLHTLGLPYVGPAVLGSAVCMDKEVTKRLLRDSGLPIVPFRVVRRGEQPAYEAMAEALGATLFVKPANSGSSVGTSKAENAAGFEAALALAFQYDHKVLVETAVEGREVECAVLGNEDPQASVPGEIVMNAAFYTYEAKYLDADASRMEVPAEIPTAAAERIRAQAVAACRVLGCEGMARVDFFLTPEHDVFINEVNTIPGFTERSMYPVMWAETGRPFPALVDELIRLALDRHARDARLKTTRS